MRFFARITSPKIAGIALSLLVMGLLFQEVSAYPADQDASIYIPESVGFNNSIYTLAIQTNGKVLAGGAFTTYGGVTANRLIRLNSDGTRDASFTIGSGFNNFVRAITIQNDGKIIVGGLFTTYNGIVSNDIIRLNTDGSKDTSFTIGSGFNGNVRSIAIQNDNKILVGGGFSTYNGTTANRLIRLNTDGTKDTSFNILNGFNNNNIRSIAIQNDNKILVGGDFTIYSGVTTNRIIRLNSDGTRDGSFIIGSGFDNQINSITMTTGGKIIVGGLFTSYSGVTANRIIRLNSDGTRDASFDIGSGFNDQVRSLIFQNNGNVFVGGAFTTYKGITTNRIVTLNSNGSIDTSFDIGSGFNNTVNFVAFQNDEKIIIGGDFTTYKSMSGAYLARLHGNSLVSLLNTMDTNKIYTEFTSKGYTLSGTILSGAAPIVFIDTQGRVPVEITINNNNSILTLPQNIEIKNKSNGTDYTGRFFPPTFITPNNQPTNTISAISVGATDRSLQLTSGFATLSIPTSGKNIGDSIQVHYSEDNGTTWHPQSITNVIDIGGQAYVQFTTDHFTDFAITDFTGSFVINNDAASTTTSGVTLNMSTTPTATNMRFSDNGTIWSTRETYATSAYRTLPGTYGTKTVYAQFDTDNNTSTIEVSTSDEIIYSASGGGSCAAGSYCGDLKLRITTGHSYCQYGTTLDFGTTGLSYSGRSLITGFVTTGGNPEWFCEDQQGLGTRGLTIQSSDLVNISTNIAAQTIPASRVYIKNPAAYIPQGEGVCTFSSGDSLNQRVNLSGAKEILGKVGVVGEGCKIITDNVSLKLVLTGSQAIGQYSGTLTINVPNF